MVHFQGREGLVSHILGDDAPIRLAMRGVPRLRLAISMAPSRSMGTSRMPAERVTMRQSSSGV